MDEAVLDRVRKLLALAGSPNVHEAAAAAARAQALISRHRLEGWLAAEAAAKEKLDAIEDARDAPLEQSKRLRRWKVVLASTLAEANGCLAYTLDRGDERAIVLVGRAEDRDAVRVLWDGLVRRIEWLSATHGAGRSKRWHDDFRIGAVDAIAKALATPAEPDAETAALTRFERAATERVQRFAERLNLKPGRAILVDPDAWRRGRQAGDALAPLVRPVDPKR